MYVHFIHIITQPVSAAMYLPDEVRSRLFQEKVKIISLQKGISNLAYTQSGVSVVLDLATAMDR